MSCAISWPDIGLFAVILLCWYYIWKLHGRLDWHREEILALRERLRK